MMATVYLQHSKSIHPIESEFAAAMWPLVRVDPALVISIYWVRITCAGLTALLANKGVKNWVKGPEKCVVGKINTRSFYPGWQARAPYIDRGLPLFYVCYATRTLLNFSRARSGMAGPDHINLPPKPPLIGHHEIPCLLC